MILIVFVMRASNLCGGGCQSACGSWQCAFLAAPCAKAAADAFGETFSHRPPSADVEPRHVQKVRDSEEDDDPNTAAHHDVKDFRIACWYAPSLYYLPLIQLS